MRSALTAFLVVAASAAGAAEVPATSALDSVTVYPDGASVVRVVKVDVPAGEHVVTVPDFPLSLDPSSLRVEGSSRGEVSIGAVESRPPKPGQPQQPDYAAIEKLNDQVGQQDDIIEAASMKVKLLGLVAAGRLPVPPKEEGAQKQVIEIKPALVLMQEESLAASREIRAANERKRDLERRIEALRAQVNVSPPAKMEVRIGIASKEKVKAELRVTYTVRAARWLPLYDVKLTSPDGKNAAGSVEIVRRTEITQRSGEDWTDVPLAVSTVRTQGGTAATSLPPLFARYRPQAVPMASSGQNIGGIASNNLAAVQSARVRPAYRQAQNETDSQQMALAPAAPPPMQAMRERETLVETGGYQVVYRVPGLSTVASDDAGRSFRLSASSVKPEIVVKAVPSADSSAFIEASFKHEEESPLLPGKVLVYRDGTYVGQGRMEFTAKAGKVRLGFGVDEKVKVARIEVRKVQTTPSGVTGFIASSKSDEREYKFTVHNGHDVAVKVRIEDRLPVSDNEEIKVEGIAGSTQPTEQDASDRRGVVAWNVDMPPASDKAFPFGWKVSWPKDKDVFIAN